MTKMFALGVEPTPDVPRKFMPRQLERFRDRDIGKWGRCHLHDTGIITSGELKVRNLAANSETAAAVLGCALVRWPFPTSINEMRS